MTVAVKATPVLIEEGIDREILETILPVLIAVSHELPVNPVKQEHLSWDVHVPFALQTEGFVYEI